jgi:dihydroorotase
MYKDILKANDRNTEKLEFLAVLYMNKLSESEISYRMALSGIDRKLEFYELAATTRSTRSRTYKGSTVIINVMKYLVFCHPVNTGN